MDETLTIDDGDQCREHAPHTRVVLGRGPDATHQLDRYDEDAHLSREAVVLAYDDGFWTVSNTQGAGRLTVLVDGGSTTVLEPGAPPFLVPRGVRGRLVLQTLRRYEVGFAVPPSRSRPDSLRPPQESVPDTTDIAHDIGLSSVEIQVLACLAEPRLLRGAPADASLPTHADVMRRLSLSRKQLERQLDAIVAKLAPHVSGLMGDNSRRATDRRRRIVDFALEVGAISLADVGTLPAPPTTDVGTILHHSASPQARPGIHPSP